MSLRNIVIITFVLLCALFSLFIHVKSNIVRYLNWNQILYDNKEEVWTEFQAFAMKFNKTYGTFEEMQRRFNIFRDNFYWIKVQNQRNINSKFDVNHFADLTQEEFQKTYLGYKGNSNRIKNYVQEKIENVADSIDWQQKGAVTAVKDQSQCGSCWAFSAVGSLEGVYFQKIGRLISFSEQELIDCSGLFGNQGCNGGQMDFSFQYWYVNSEETESDYPYTGIDGICKQSEIKGVTRISGYVDVPTNELALKNAVNGRVISVAVDASDWSYYAGGIYNGYCSTSLNHGVTLVGYGTENGQDYWRIKNSWNTWWGESGYIRLKRIDSSSSGGQCGVATAALYPTLWTEKLAEF